MKKENEKNKRVGLLKKSAAGLVAGALALSMAVGLMQPAVETKAAGKNVNINGFSSILNADPDTSESSHIFNGTPAEDGKIWSDKSVTTGAIYGVSVDEDNFGVALSAVAQTYNKVETSVTTEAESAAFDVVFVLDFSGSMNYGMASTSNSNATVGQTRADAMVNALNPAIETLMENENNRIAVVGYSGSDVGSSNAETILTLDHYTAGTKDSKGNKLYFSYGSSGSNRRISIVNEVRNSANVEMSKYKNVTGGTPTQRGIYDGMQILMNADLSNEHVTRIPIMIILSDGKAGSARANYDTLSGNSVYGDANGSGGSTGGLSSNNYKVGAYTILTANYAKDQINNRYTKTYDYDGITSTPENVMQVYSIGLAIDDESWTHFMLDPSTTNANNDSVVKNMKTILGGDDTYNQNYDYADNYFGGQMTAEELHTYFGEIIEQLKADPMIHTTVNAPIASDTTSVTGADMVFTDYLGYKMELKGTSQYLRYGGVNYRFNLDTANSTDTCQTYRYSGYDQDGNAKIGPTIAADGKTYTLADITFKAEWDAAMTVNGQTGYWKVTFRFPGAMLPTYSRKDGYDNKSVDAIRMLYEVGLEDDVDLQNDALKLKTTRNHQGQLTKVQLVSDISEANELVFHANLADYEHAVDSNGLPKATATVEYTPAADNPYYYETGYTTEDPNPYLDSDKQFVRLDLVSTTSDDMEIEGKTDVQLSNISVNRTSTSTTAQFKYNGVDYTVVLSGDDQNNAVWEGKTDIEVTATTINNQSITEKVAAIFKFTLSKMGNYRTFTLSEVSVNGQRAAIGDNKVSALVSELSLSKTVPDPSTTKTDVTTVYMELKGNAATGYYVEDAEGNKIDVTVENGKYKIVFGEETYYSTAYYKYPAGTKNYANKELAKGAIAKSLVGKFVVNQLSAKTSLTKDNFDEIFQYTASNGTTYKATRAVFENEDGTEYVWGAPLEKEVEILDGTFQICVDGIQNGQTDINGKPMVVHFDFIIEEQKLSDDSVRYVVLDCNYTHGEVQNYAVDVTVSDTPHINEEDNKYVYDVSYTIQSTHSSGEENVTETDPHFFHSRLEGGQVEADLGNNGRVLVDLDDVYDKDITVKKEWRNRLGDLITNFDEFGDMSVTVGLYQMYSYTDSMGNQIVHDDFVDTAYDTVELNKDNGFSHTWESTELPKYLVSSNGSFVMDYSKNQSYVPVRYEVREIEGADGWTVSNTEKEENATTETHTITNVPLTTFTPRVEKIWSTDGVVDTVAPDGYKVKIELLADGKSINAQKLDAEHIVKTKLTKLNDTDKSLKVWFGEEYLGEQDILGSTVTGEGSIVTFDYKPEGGIGGEVGSGSHADGVSIIVEVQNTSTSGITIKNLTLKYIYTDSNNNPVYVALNPYRTSVEENEGVKTESYLMAFETSIPVSVTLDGVVDTGADAKELEPWKYSWDHLNLPLLKYDEATQKYTSISYSVKETLIVGNEEYTPDSNGLITIGNLVYKSDITHTTDYAFTLTNDKGVKTITVDKVWVDNNNKYNTRPDSITFKLKANGNATDSAYDRTISKDATTGKWESSVTWENLPKYDSTTGAEITYTIDEIMNGLPSDQYETNIVVDEKDPNHVIVTNRLDDNATSMSVEKVWVDNNNKYQTRPENLYMVLFRQIDGDSGEPQIVPAAEVYPVIALNNSNQWKDVNSWKNLPKYNEEGKRYIYSVGEYYYPSVTNPITDIPGYDLKSTEITYEASGNEYPIGYKFTNQLEDGTVWKTVTKDWRDAEKENDRPETVTVRLYATTDKATIVDLNPADTAEDAVFFEQVLTAPNWSHSWNNLAEYYNGEKIDYTIVEAKVGDVEVLDNKAAINGNVYAVSVADDGAGNVFAVTNTLTGTTEVSVTKTWENKPDGFIAPEIIFDIISSDRGISVGTLTVGTETNPITDSMTGLPKYNIYGGLIDYTVSERKGDSNDEYTYVAEINENTGTDGNFAYNVTNTYIPLTQIIEGTKTWVGVTGNNIPEDITVELYRQVGNEEKELVVAEPTWTKDGNRWTFVYADLPIYKDGNLEEPYVYSVKETKIETADVTYAENGISGTCGDYKIALDGMNITNTLEGTVSGTALSGTKTWETNGTVPDSISIELWRKIGESNEERAIATDGSYISRLDVNKTGQTNDKSWTFNFGDILLPKYDKDGNLYTYFVKEYSITSGNTTTLVTGSNNDRVAGDYVVTDGIDMSITNTVSTKNTTEFTIYKNWIWTGTLDKFPESIAVQLYKDGVAYGEETVLTAQTTGVTVNEDENIWIYTFSNLPLYKEDGITLCDYSIQETKIGGTALVDGSAGEWDAHISDSDLITNSHEADLIDLTVEKAWVGVEGNNCPDSIQVQLYYWIGNNKPSTLNEMGVPTTISASTGWKHKYEGLPTSTDGLNSVSSRYHYLVKELSVTKDGITETSYDDTVNGVARVGDYTISVDINYNEGIFYDGNESNKVKTVKITNTLNADNKKVTTTYPVEKTWDIPEDATLPESITVQLKQNGTVMTNEKAKAVLTAANKVNETNPLVWDYIFTGLDKYTSDGITQHVYTAEETKIGNLLVSADHKAGDYFVSYPQQNGVMTKILNSMNTSAPETTEVRMTKTWDIPGNVSIPENITVDLVQDEAVCVDDRIIYASDVTVGEDTNGKTVWTYSFGNLPKYKKDGVTPYVYSVKETKIEETDVVEVDRVRKAGNYTVLESGMNIVNRITEAAVKDITVTKTWNNIALNSVPDSIEFRLYKDGVVYETATMTKPNWSYTFTNLPIYSDGVNEISYTVEETKITSGNVTLEVQNIAENEASAGDYTVTYPLNEYKIVNTLNNETTEYSFTKIWDVPVGTKLPNNITVQLMQNGTAYGNSTTLGENDVIIGTNAAGKATWTYEFTNLPKYADDGVSQHVYGILETKVGNTVVTGGRAGGYVVSINGDAIINKLTTNTQELLTSVTVQKVWSGIEEAAVANTHVEVQLYQDGQPFESIVGLRKENNWSYTFTNLPKYSDGATECVYTVKEIALHTVDKREEVVYQKDSEGNDILTQGTVGVFAVSYSNDGLTVTNTKTDKAKETTSISFNKVWKDASGEVITTNLPSSIKVRVLQNGQPMTPDQTVTLTAAEPNGWAATVGELPKYVADGITLHSYTVEEIKVENIDVVNGAAGKWIVEVDENHTITNTLALEPETSVTVSKKWLNAAGEEITEASKQPSNVTLEILQKQSDDSQVSKGTIVLSKENGWTETVSGLPKYMEDGVTEYIYTFKETAIDGVTLVNNVAGNWSFVSYANGVITNKLTGSETTSIEIQKVWKDATGEEITTNLPESITARVLQNGQPMSDDQIVTLTAAAPNSWSATVTGLPKYEADGITPYMYTVEETMVEDHIVIDGKAGDWEATVNGTVITNQKTDNIRTTEATVTKVWKDASGEEITTNLPASIKVRVLQDGQVMTPDKTVVLTADDNWTKTINDLPLYKLNGADEYKYTFEEIEIGGVAVNGSKAGAWSVETPVVNGNNTTITNTRSDAKTSVTITKTWVGVSAQNTPEITVQLIRDGENYGTPVKLNKDTAGVTVVDNNWTYKFENLPEYRDDGTKLSVYSVREVSIGEMEVAAGTAGDYSVSVNGFHITNKLGGTVVVEGEKVWDDAGKETLRPETITVNLLRNNASGTAEILNTKEISAADEWQFTFTTDAEGKALEKYDPDGNLYSYSVEEAGVSNGLYTVTDSDGNISHQYSVSYSTADGKQKIHNTIPGDDSKATVEITGKKTISGREFMDGDQFTFVIAPITANAPMPVNDSVVINAVAGNTEQNVSFGTISFTKEGIYQYKITETRGAIGGILYDTSEWIATVTVNWNNTAKKYEAKVSYTDNVEENKTGFVFENIYKAGAIELVGENDLKIAKSFTGRKDNQWLDTDVFKFELKADTDTERYIGTTVVFEDNKALRTMNLEITKENKDNAYFGNIKFYEAGIYHFLISEVNTGAGGITYDTEPVKVKVTVTDDRTGSLKTVAATTVGDTIFENEYKVTPTTVQMIGKKTLNGRKLLANEFKFKLEAVDGAPMPTDETTITAFNEADGTIQFAPITYKEPGIYRYKIVEDTSNPLPGIVTYDTATVEAVVTITDDNQGGLQSNIQYIKYELTNNTFEFVNKYDAKDVGITLGGDKFVENDETYPRDLFEFMINPLESNRPSDPVKAADFTKTVSSDKDGKYTFGNMVYTEPGTYVYTISEVKGSLAGIEYDPTIYTITVEVTDVNAELIATVKNGTSEISLTDAGSAFDFTNEYNTSETTAIITGKKVLENKDLVGGEFQFKIEALTEGAPMPANVIATNNEAGIFAFDKIIYNKAEHVDTWEYQITEVMPEKLEDRIPGVSYSTQSYKVVVKVTDTCKEGCILDIDHLDDCQVISLNNENELPETKEKSEEPKVCQQGCTIGTGHEGECVVPTSCQEGCTREAGHEGECVVPTSCQEGCTREAGHEGECAVETMESQEPEEAVILGRIKDANPIKFVLTGETGGGNEEIPIPTGILRSSVTIEGESEIVFTNTYKPNEVVIDGTLLLDGKKIVVQDEDAYILKAGDFEFEILTNDDNTPLPEKTVVTNDEFGNFEFGDIVFANPGTYYYTIIEKNTTIAGITNDTISYELKVVVTDEGKDGQLDYEVTYYEFGKTEPIHKVTSGNVDVTEMDIFAFKNKYKAASTKAQLSVTKKLTGRTLAAEEFEFKIEALTTGAPLPVDAEGNVITTTKNDAAGIAYFNEIIFEQAGTYEYKVTEIAGNAPYVTYDQTEYKVTIVITDNGEGYLNASIPVIDNLTNPIDDPTVEESLIFTNTYKEPPKPKDPTPEEPEEEPEYYPVPEKPTQTTGTQTGDSANIGGLFGLLGLAAAGFAGIKIFKRKKQ